MSIPPLVCSTPPPPDQCEDDKDPGDFDIPYNLSQEDEEDENTYGYSGFSSYSNIQAAHSTIEIKSQDLDKNTDNVAPNETHDQKPVTTNNISSVVCENILKCEEDVNIEDLNLELDEELGSNIEFKDEGNRSIEINNSSLKEVHVPSITTISQNDNNTDSMSIHDQIVTESIDKVKESNIDVDRIIEGESSENNTIFEANVRSEHVADVQKTSADNSEESTLSFEETVIYKETSEKVGESLKELDAPEEIFKSSKDNVIDDDFGDFEDFQCANSENKITSVDNCDNPWENNETEDDSEFGSFTANFEQTEFKPFPATEIKTDPCENQIIEINNDLDDDDDFGDFDDFKSSLVTTEAIDSTLKHSSPCEDVPVLNLHATENEQQILESISNVLTSIFVEEMTEPETEFEGKLESLLSETWGHLMQTDERQPYIVHWNNSLGQKTLLKSLCIDSRNILFGPKWNTNMPKYAANLTAAPLQPQKPVTPSNACPSEAIIDKSSSKPATWTDPFTSDGQESCNPEPQTPPVTTRPTDLDVFEAAMTAKPEKIYSSTLSVQPRQISLPDTHIFTPTDSETPRSKTIHYDCSPTVLLPQPVIKDPTSNENIDGIVGATEDDSEYLEFQGFQSNSNTRSLSQGVKEDAASSERNIGPATSNKSLPTPAVPFQTQPLQPIKVEPAVPALNWPEPGEVKGAFDDFSDFVSSSSQSTEKQSVAFDLPVFQAEISNNNESDNFSDLNVQTEHSDKGVGSSTSEDFVDDFDTFKSAMPSLQTKEFVVNNVVHPANQTTLSNITDFANAFPNSNTFKSETISFPSITRPNEALTQPLGHLTNTSESTSKSSMPSGTLQTNMLQPTPVSFSAANTKKTGQILQPLSLESYSQINWPSPGIDLQDLSRFNPVETLQSLKSDLSVGGLSKSSSPVHSQKGNANQVADDDVWGEFVSSKPKPQQPQKKQPVFVDDDEWTDFISSPSVKPHNGLNTISLNVYTNSNNQKTSMQNKLTKSQAPLDIPTLNYITPKSSNAKSYNDRHFQNL